MFESDQVDSGGSEISSWLSNPRLLDQALRFSRLHSEMDTVPVS
jgi:hypothetical protein